MVLDIQHVIIGSCSAFLAGFLMAWFKRQKEINEAEQIADRNSQYQSKIVAELREEINRIKYSNICSERNYLNEIEVLKQSQVDEKSILEEDIRLLTNKFQSLTVEFFRLKKFAEVCLEDWREQSVTFPLLRRWMSVIQNEYDDLIEKDLVSRTRPAWVAAKHVKLARSEARIFKRESEALQARINLYETLAPWLEDYTEYSVDELLAGISREQEMKDSIAFESDPVERYVPKSDWHTLSVTDRNQLALDRYWESRLGSAWLAGVQYERYIGWRYESMGWKVDYHGARLGREDMGIDLVCSLEGKVAVVQCKRLSATKGLPVRENTVAQTYGAAFFWKMKHRLTDDVKPVLVTSYELSSTAASFAKFLGVEIWQRVPMKAYPCIKCNIGRNGEKIYHLPFDQQYDVTMVGVVPGEFYAMTVKDAEDAGFRRAWKWMGA